MNNDNDKTLQSYNDHIVEYVASMAPTMNADSKTWIDQALTLIPDDGTILELGSGAGRDAEYITSKGYEVIATDAAPGFVMLLSQAGLNARLLNALTDDYGSGYDMILADAVLLHFELDEVQKVFNKTLASLKPEGIFVFSLKQGSGSEWSQEKINAPRYFRYWERPELEAVVTKAGFEIVAITTATSRSASWLQVIAKKP